MMRTGFLLAILALTGCSSSQNLDVQAVPLNTEELNLLLVGKVAVFDSGSKANYFTDGSYLWTSADRTDAGKYTMADNQACVQFDEGGSRCDRYERLGERYAIIVEGNQRYPVVRIETASKVAQIAQGYLSEDQIRPTFAGNTIKFADFKTKRPVYILLQEDGEFEMRSSGSTGNGKWWIGENATFCREYSNGSRKSCLRPQMQGSFVSFHESGGKKAYEAELLPGNQLP